MLAPGNMVLVLSVEKVIELACLMSKIKRQENVPYKGHSLPMVPRSIAILTDHSITMVASILSK